MRESCTKAEGGAASSSASSVLAFLEGRAVLTAVFAVAAAVAAAVAVVDAVAAVAASPSTEKETTAGSAGRRESIASG